MVREGSIEYRKGKFYLRGTDGQLYTSAVSKRGRHYWRKERSDSILERMSPARRDSLLRFSAIARKSMGQPRSAVKLSTGLVVTAPGSSSHIQREMTGWRSDKPRSNKAEEGTSAKSEKTNSLEEEKQIVEIRQENETRTDLKKEPNKN